MTPNSPYSELAATRAQLRGAVFVVRSPATEVRGAGCVLNPKPNAMLPNTSQHDPTTNHYKYIGGKDLVCVSRSLSQLVDLAT